MKQYRFDMTHLLHCPLLALWLPLIFCSPDPPPGIMFLVALLAQRSLLLHLLRLHRLISLNQFLPSSSPSNSLLPSLKDTWKEGEKSSAWNVHWDFIHILYQFPDHKISYWQRKCSMIMPKMVPFTLCLKQSTPRMYFLKLWQAAEVKEELFSCLVLFLFRGTKFLFTEST